jgi:GT2 family glycosyltransferase
MTLRVVTVAYGGQEDVARLSAQVAAWADTQLVIVDNSPEAHRISVVTTLDLGGNVGYARGVNAAAAVAGDWEYLLVVNPDVLLVENPRSVAHRFDDPRVIAVCGRLRTPGGAATPNLHPRATVGRELLRSVVSSRAYRDRGRSDLAREVDQADGAWLLFTRASWERLGGMDERFELYFEDVELCDRIRSSGGVLLYDPRLVGEHAAGSSARRAGGLSHCLLGVSRTRYYHLSGLTSHPAALGRLTAVLEFLSRSVTLRPEGQATRLTALRQQWQEAGRPGSVWLLGAARSLETRVGRDAADTGAA